MLYVIAPNSELSVVRGLLHLAQPSQPRVMRLPIDVLFCPLAREQGERAIGVVLSGMGSDGTIGLQAIKTQGGLTLAQQPESAQFDSMPVSAIAADIVAPPSELPLSRRVAGVGKSVPGPRGPGPRASDSRRGGGGRLAWAAANNRPGDRAARASRYWPAATGSSAGARTRCASSRDKHCGQFRAAGGGTVPWH